MKLARIIVVGRNPGRLALRAFHGTILLALITAAMCGIHTASRLLADDSRPASRASDNVAADDNRANPLRRTAGPDLPTINPPSQAPTSAYRLPYYQPVTDDAPPPPGAFEATANPPPRGIQPLPTRPPEFVAGIPSAAATFPKQTQPPANCNDPQSGYPALFGQPDQNQTSPGSQTPTLYQPGHYPRSLGFGEPLVGTSWQNRPFHADFFTGTMIGDDAIDGVIGQEAGFFVGGRLGWDYDYYWGMESRLGTAWMSLFDRQHPENNIGTGNILVWDMNLLYYPWGDSRWRPFLLVGVGIEQLDSYGSALPIYSGTLFEIPWGAGLKYQYNEWLAWRFDVIDNFAIGTGSLDTMHNVSFSAGLEFHFGGHRRSYWPWNPNPRH